MHLRDFMASLNQAQRETFAAACGTSRGHLQNVSYGKKCSAELAAAVERESAGAVTRRELRPLDYLAVWPELALQAA